MKIKELEFNHEGKLETGCMLILEKQNEYIRVAPVPIRGIIGFMHKTWRYMWSTLLRTEFFQRVYYQLTVAGIDEAMRELT